MINYSIFNSISGFIIGYLVYFHGLIGFLMADPTFITPIILGLYLVLTTYLGFKGYEANFTAIKGYRNLFPYLGLAGTLIGISILLYAVAYIDPTNTTLLMQTLLIGFAKALSTTLFGVIAWIIMTLQIMVCFKEYKDE